MRGSIVRRLDPQRFEVRESWSACAGLIDGFRFRLLRGGDRDVVVGGFDPRSGLLTLDADPGPVESGAAFEVRSPEEAPLLAARLLSGTPAAQPLPPCDLRLATTLGTNALLQRAGVPTALFVTRGFADLPAIRDQQRAELFRLDLPRLAVG